MSPPNSLATRPRPSHSNESLKAAPVFVDIDGVRFALIRILRHRRVAGLLCEAPPGSPLPSYPLRRRIRAMLSGAYSGGDLTIFTDSARSAEIWSWSLGGRRGPLRALERLQRANDTGSVWDIIDTSRRIDAASDRSAWQTGRVVRITSLVVLRLAGRNAALFRLGGSVARLVHDNPERYGMAESGKEPSNDLLAGIENSAQLLQDLLEDPESIEGIRAIWQALRRVRIIDPACGRGDWLIGVLGTLEQLYLSCLEQMQIRLNEEVISREPRPASYLRDFRIALARTGPDQRRWVREAILLDNLHGTDLTTAAAASCRRRLAAWLRSDQSDHDPLPPAALNVATGNLAKGLGGRGELERALRGTAEAGATLTRILEELDALGRASRLLRTMRLDYGGSSETTERALDALLGRRKALAGELNAIAARAAGVDPGKRSQMSKWVEKHRPLHLLCEWPHLDPNRRFDLTRADAHDDL